MKCPECIKEGKKSTIYVKESMTTSIHFLPFYDEEGRFHYHNPNITTTTYHCSNDHVRAEHTQSKCWCEKEREE